MIRSMSAAAIAQSDAWSEAMLENALSAAHLPTLMVALVHLTGSTDHLLPELRPVYRGLGGDLDGLNPDQRARTRDLVRDSIRGWPKAGPPIDAAPSPAAVRQMLDFVTGSEISETYVPFLLDELSLDGSDVKHPHWDQPKLQAAAKRLKVLVIGAGMSGLLAGIRLKQAGIGFEIIEKNLDVGGTWFENTYPGCRVDSTNHLYSYSFEPNHQFPNHFSKQGVLRRYFSDVADRHGLRSHIRFDTVVESAQFDEATGQWQISIHDADGKVETLAADAVISAVGQLNRPRLPDIPGRESFAGPAFHSAEWRRDVQLAGRRVAVIGTGASAFQFVPEIAAKVAHLDVYQRTPPWLIPTPHYHDDVPEGKKWLLQHFPLYAKWYRFWLFWMSSDGLLPAVKVDPAWNGPPTAISDHNQAIRNLIVAGIERQVAGRPELLDKLVPDYPIGGKRALRDNGVWAAALQRDNVDLVTTGIREIVAEGIVTRDCVLHPADVLVYGTGFQASRFLMPMRVTGRGGKDLHQAWGGEARAYLGVGVPDFPNFFMLYGPNTNIVVNGSIIFFSECGMRYIMGCLKLLAETGSRTLEVRREVHDAFNDRVDAANREMAWGQPGIDSWYKSGRVSQNWPFALVDYWRATVKPDPADFKLA